MAYEGHHMGGTRRSHLGAGNVLELDLDGGHTAVHSIKNSSSRLGSVCLHGPHVNKVLFKNTAGHVQWESA